MQHDPQVVSLDVATPWLGERTATTSPIEISALQGRIRRLASRAVLGLAVLLLIVAGALHWLQDTYDDQVFPSVYVADMNLGGLTFAEATDSLDERISLLNETGIAFSYGGKQWTPSLEQLGVSFDTESSLDRAFEIGREVDAWQRMSSTTSLLRDDHRVPLTIELDRNKLNAWFDRADRELGLPPHEAYLVVEGDQVRIEPEVNGTIVDRAAAEQVLFSVLDRLQPVQGALPVVSMTATIHADDLVQAQQQLQTALSQPIKLEYERESWTLNPADLGQFVVQSIDPAKQGAAAVTVSLDEKGLARWLNEKIAPEINRDPVDAKVGWNDKLVSLEPSVDGIKLKPTTLSGAVAGSFFSNHSTIEVPVTVISPRVDSNNLGALGITHRIGVGDSNFDGSDGGRAENIRVGANLLNGTLVPPHGDFSFNHSIGVISTDSGFVESQIIDGQDIGRDIGGGICQVSTTAFRAALMAGMPIVEWWPHTYQLSFYETNGWTAGLDASILQPEGDPFGGGDFRFQNPFDTWLLVESYTVDADVVIVIYGPDSGYQVNISEPAFGQTYPEEPNEERVDPELPPGTIKQMMAAQEGLDVSYTREVLDRDGNVVLQDDFITHFYARGNVWQVSPDMQGKSPAASS
ncbi:MAG: VanW family protein [Thermomicrobiales bacterium]